MTKVIIKKGKKVCLVCVCVAMAFMDNTFKILKTFEKLIECAASIL